MPAETNPAGILSSPGKSETLQNGAAALVSEGQVAENCSTGDIGRTVPSVMLSTDALLSRL
jgi:hypothetical protein